MRPFFFTFSAIPPILTMHHLLILKDATVLCKRLKVLLTRSLAQEMTPVLPCLPHALNFAGVQSNRKVCTSASHSGHCGRQFGRSDAEMDGRQTRGHGNCFFVNHLIMIIPFLHQRKYSVIYRSKSLLTTATTKTPLLDYRETLLIIDLLSDHYSPSHFLIFLYRLLPSISTLALNSVAPPRCVTEAPSDEPQ